MIFYHPSTTSWIQDLDSSAGSRVVKISCHYCTQELIVRAHADSITLGRQCQMCHFIKMKVIKDAWKVSPSMGKHSCSITRRTTKGRHRAYTDLSSSRRDGGACSAVIVRSLNGSGAIAIAKVTKFLLIMGS
eukprot:2184715-Amphidinium_carterae.1